MLASTNITSFQNSAVCCYSLKQGWFQDPRFNGLQILSRASKNEVADVSKTVSK